MDLFDQQDGRSDNRPLAERMRPRTLDEYVGQGHLLGAGSLLRQAVAEDRLFSVIFWGPPGSGKTTLARILAQETKSHFVSFSAVLSGVGDVDVGARWALWRRVAFVPDAKRVAVTRAQALAIAAGTSLPTGENGAGRDGVRLEEHAQIGTGAFGPYAGLLYQLQREPWSLSSTIIARFRTENRHGYRFGDALLAAADVQRDALPWLSVGVGVDVRWAAVDRQGGGAVESTGGVVTAATPSVSVGLAPGLSARVRAQLPLVQRLRGEQRADPAVLAGISWDGA